MLQAQRAETEIVVLAHGCFDVLHLGHIRHLQEARALGDRLIVSITADPHVNKGPGRPQFNAQQRREQLLALDCVDEVVVSIEPTAIDSIRAVRPAIYVKGADYAGSDDRALAEERAAVEGTGGRIHFTTAEKWSSSLLLRSARLPDAALAYLDGARARGFLDQILAAVERADRLQIAFVGETIVDEYRYVKPLAKPSKEFILATVAAGDERFEGGVIAAAKHCDWSNAQVVTSPTAIVKTRFVDADFSRKLFEVYSAREIALSQEERKYLRGALHGVVGGADVAIVLDFGHGLLGESERDLLAESRFLAVTAQTNAGNYGFNPIGKYRHADYVCVDEPEARLAACDQDGPLDDVMFRIARYAKARAMTVTRGRYGSVSRSALGGGGKMAVPAFVESGFDTMGAGDAFIATAAPLVAAGLDVEMAAFAGNVAGGLKTSILGHRRHVGRDDLVKNIEWLLK